MTADCFGATPFWAVVVAVSRPPSSLKAPGSLILADGLSNRLVTTDYFAKRTPGSDYSSCNNIAKATSWVDYDSKECISITRSSTSARTCTSRIFRPSANACCEIPFPVIVRAISLASANVRASSASRGGVGKTLFARFPPTKPRAPALPTGPPGRAASAATASPSRRATAPGAP